MASDVSTTPITILHLEDDPAFARKAKQSLSAITPAIEIDLVNTQKSFTNHLKNKTYDLILLDDHVPDGSGLEALKIINDNQILSSVVMLSDLLDEGRIVKSIKLGAADYLLKSNQEGLLDTVRNVRIENLDSKPTINFRNFYEASPDLLCALNNTGEFVSVNNSWSHIFGVPIAELVGKSFVEFVHSNYRDNAMLQFNKLFQEPRGSSNLTSCFMAQNGDVIWLQWNASEPTNNIIYVTARDISELKQQSNKLLKEQIELKNLIEEYKSELNRKSIVADQIHDSIITTDLKGFITNWNKGSEEVFGYNSGEAMGQHISMVYPDKDYKYIQEQGGDILLEQGSRDLEIQMRRKSGEIFSAKLSLSVTRDDNGEVNGMVGYAVELGPAQPEEISAQTEQDLDAAMQQIRDLEQQLKNSEDLLNKADQELLQIDSDLLQAREKLEASEEKSRQLEQTLQDSENQVNNAKQDKPESTHADIETVNISSDEATQENQHKSEFLASISHELRVTLNAILGFSQVIGLDETLSENNKKYLAEISNAGTTLLDTVTQLIDVVKLEAGKHELNKVTVNLNQLVEQCIEQLEYKAGDKLTINLATNNNDDPIFAHTDEQRLQQVISYVIPNAVKYSSDGENFVITTQYENDKALIKIASPNTRKLPLDKSAESALNTLDTSGQKGLTSTRIELLITQTLLKLMGGNIHYEFDPDKVIVITIPTGEASENEAPYNSDEKQPAASPQDNKLVDTILYIEEDDTNVRLVETLLAQRPNCKLVSMQTPEHLLDTAKTKSPSIILLDTNIENIDYHALISQLQQDNSTKSIPVVAISTNASPEEMENAETAGFASYLTKPLEIKTFLSLIDSLLTPQEVQSVARRS